MKLKQRSIPYIAAAILLFILLVFGSYARQMRFWHTLEEIGKVPSKTRLLVLTLQPEKDLPSVYGLLKEVRSRQGSLHIISTGKENNPPKKEIQSLLNSLHLTKESMEYLNYSREDMDRAWQSPAGELHHDVTTALADRITKYHPTMVLYPHPQDQDRDYAAAYALLRESMISVSRPLLTQYLYLTNYTHWPSPGGKNPTFPLVPPAPLRDKGTFWYTLSLKGHEKITKEKLGYFPRINELYGVYPNIRMPLLEPGPAIPVVIIEDPKEDAANTIGKRRNIPSADILSIGITHNEKNITFQLKTAGRIDSQYRYTLHIVPYGFTGPGKKISISYENGKVVMDTDGQHPLPSTVEDKKITCQIPKSYFPDIIHIFLQGTTDYKDQKIDNTLWRMIQLY